MTTYTLSQIPNGKPGVAATLAIMRRLTRSGKKTPLIRELALRIVNPIPPKDWRGEITAIRDYVRSNIRYTRDIRGVETLQSPVQTLRLRAGDCDDMAILTASLLESIHHPTKFTAIGFAPNQFCHVYPQTKIAHKWVTVETTEPVRLGWIPHGIRATMERYN